LALQPAPAGAGACPVNLFREHDPGHPPGILSDLPAAQIFDSPWVDPDASMVRLTFYRVHVQTADPDPDFPEIRLDRAGSTTRVHWGGSGDPAACCIGPACSDLCPDACQAAGGVLQGPGTSCADDPPPCGGTSCVSRDSFFGLAKESGGGVSFEGSGFATLMPVGLNAADMGTGAATPLALTLADEEARVWNFTGAQAPETGLLYHAGGRANHATIGATVVTVDTAAESLVSSVPLSPAVNLVHLDRDNATGTLYGLAAGPGNILHSAGNIVFTGQIELVTVDPGTGAVTTVASSLPADLENFAATLDTEGRRYFYHTVAGELHAVDLDSGWLATAAVPGHFVDLQFDDATGTLYGLETWGSNTFEASGDRGYRTLGEIALVSIDTDTGLVTTLSSSPLPTGTTNFSSAFDCVSGHYLYVSDTGESQVLDAATGDLIATAPPPGTSRFHSLD